ncbi:MAG: site-specific DNA-methyltransferase, partial [Defluviitoga tunisiensis]
AGKLLDEQSGIRPSGKGNGNAKVGVATNGQGVPPLRRGKLVPRNDTGGASRFFYCAKASKKERGEGNNHPTVKPLSLIKYLITLVTPPEGVCLDPFEGSGTHALACEELGFNYIGFELDKQYYDIANKRIQKALM